MDFGLWLIDTKNMCVSVYVRSRIYVCISCGRVRNEQCVMTVWNNNCRLGKTVTHKCRRSYTVTCVVQCIYRYAVLWSRNLKPLGRYSVYDRTVVNFVIIILYKILRRIMCIYHCLFTSYMVQNEIVLSNGNRLY